MVWLKKTKTQNVKSKEQHSKSVLEGDFWKSVDGKIFKIFLQACSRCSQPGIQNTASWPFHLRWLLIMAALWSAPPCKDISAPIQCRLYVCPSSVQSSVRRDSEENLRQFNLTDSWTSCSLAFFSFLFGLSGFISDRQPFFLKKKKSWR